MNSTRHQLLASCVAALALFAAVADAGSGPPMPDAPSSESPARDAPSRESVTPPAETSAAISRPQSAAVHPDLKAEAKPDVKPDVKADVKPEAKPEVKAETQSPAPKELSAEAKRNSDRFKPLGTPQAAASRETSAPAAAQPSSASGWITQIASLAGVVGLIFIIGIAVRKFAPGSGLMGALGPRGKAPSGVLEVLGRYPTGRSGMLVILKFDRRILLVNQSTGRGGHAMTTLAEVTDPIEVASIITKTGGSTSVSRQFERTLKAVQGDAEALPPKEVVAAKAAPVRKPAPATVPAPPKSAPKTGDPFAELDGATAAQTLRARLASMQAAEAAAATTREFSA